MEYRNVKKNLSAAILAQTLLGELTAPESLTGTYGNVTGLYCMLPYQETVLPLSRLQTLTRSRLAVGYPSVKS